MKITVGVTGMNKVAKTIANIKKVPSNTAVWRGVGAILYRDSMRSFQNQQAPDGTPWAPLSPMTKWMRGYKRLNAFRNTLKKKKLLHTKKYKRFTGMMKILQDTGKLRGSVKVRVEQNAAVIGSALHYARIHQLGGYTTWKGKKYQVPARPYLGLSPSGQQDIVAIISTFLNKAADAEGGKE